MIVAGHRKFEAFCKAIGSPELRYFIHSIELCVVDTRKPWTNRQFHSFEEFAPVQLFLFESNRNVRYSILRKLDQDVNTDYLCTHYLKVFLS